MKDAGKYVGTSVYPNQNSKIKSSVKGRMEVERSESGER